MEKVVVCLKGSKQRSLMVLVKHSTSTLMGSYSVHSASRVGGKPSPLHNVIY